MFIAPIKPSPPQHFNDSSSTESRPGATDVWESREGEKLLIETQFVQCQCFGPRRQDPENMAQCDCRIFELANEVCGIPTKRIVLRSCEDESHYVSYCKSRWNFNVRKIKSRLNDNAQGCLWTLLTSRSRIVAL